MKSKLTKFITLLLFLSLITILVIQPAIAQESVELLPFQDDFNRTVGNTADHFAFGDRWFYVYGNKNKLGVKMENGYLDMTGYSSDGWQVPILRDNISSYDGNWWWYGCGYSSIPGDAETPLSALKVANLAPQANGHILNYEFKVLHNDLNGHFGFGLGFGDKNQQRGGLGFETHLIGSWGTRFRAYYSMRSQGKSVCLPGDLGDTYYDFDLPSFIDQPHTFRWEIDLRDPNYVKYKVYMDGALKYTSGPHYLPARDVIGFNLYQAAGFWWYPTSHSRYEYVHLWIHDDLPPTTTAMFSGTLGNNNWYTSDVQATLTAADNPGGSGVKKTEYSFDGTNWNTYTAPFTISTEGTTTVYYRSTDNAGNVETTKTETIKIDKTPPQILVNSPEAKDYLSTEKITINFAAQDNISGIATTDANIDGVPVTNSQEINLKTLSLGPNTFTASSLDQAGNRAEKSVIFNVVPVPFSSFSAKVEAEIGSEITENKLEAKGSFILGEASDGINPTNENVALSFFDVFFEIPAGSFKWFEHPKNRIKWFEHPKKPEKSEWKFEGMIDNLPIEMKIKPLGNNFYEFKFEAESLNLCWLKSPIEVGLKIGDDFGKVEAVPEIEGLENWENICSGAPSPEIETPGISPD